MVESKFTEVEVLTDRYLQGLARLDPYACVRDGVEGEGPNYTDYSTEGVARRLDFAQESAKLAKLAAPRSRHQRITAAWLAERTAGESLLWKDDLHAPLLRFLDGPMVDVVAMCGALFSRDSVDWGEVRERLSDVPTAIASMRSNLADGVARRQLGTRRQAELFADYCDDAGGLNGRGMLDWRLSEVSVPAPFQEDVVRLVDAAQSALLDLAEFVRRDYLPATEPDAPMGEERYTRRLQYYAGGELDALKLYGDSWRDYRSTMTRLRALAGEIVPSGDITEATWSLDADPSGAVMGDTGLSDWLASEFDAVYDFVAGSALPELADYRRPEVRLVRGEARSLMQLTEPKPEHQSYVWVRETGEISIPKWRYLSLCHAVVVPGSWYQLNSWLEAPALTSAQRQLFHRAGYAGCGHYVTLLLDELGYYETISSQLSFLQREVLQSVRTVVDVGFNLGLSVPADSDICAGLPWTESTGTQFMAYATFMSRQAAAGEMRRVVSCAGQYPSYRVQSNAILTGRERAGVTSKSEDRMRQFHAELLGLGPLGLDAMSAELARLPMCSDGATSTAPCSPQAES
jgi:uncharacterized protein (DUF885 family)